MIKATKEHIIFSEYETVVYSREKIRQMPRTKDNAFLQFVEMITNSWTYERLTESEQKRLLETFEQNEWLGSIKGDWKTRWSIMHAMYHCFLSALDYNATDWRETA